MLSVTLRQLEYVVAVAQYGGVSTAASAINVSQPSLSVAIARLEEEVGKSIFIRRKGGPVVPTTFGQGFIEKAQILLLDAAHLVDPAAHLSQPTKPVRIGFFEDLAPLLLAPVLKQLAKSQPDIQITHQVGGFEYLADRLSAGQLDCALTYDLGLDETIHRRPLVNIPVHALVSRTHRFASRKSLMLAELADEPLVLSDQGHSIRHMMDLFRQRGLTPRIAHRAASLETMRSLAGNDFGVGLSYTLPTTLRSYDGRELVSVRIVDAGTEEPLVLATNSLDAPTSQINAIIDVIAKIRGIVDTWPSPQQFEGPTST